MDLHEEFLLEIFFSYCRRPTYKNYQNIYNAECPICKEGKSTGRTRRLFFFPSKQYLYCHNCSKSWNPLEWVKEVTNLTFPEILKRNSEKGNGSFVQTIDSKPTQVILPDLPNGCVDLSNPAELEFYKTNEIVKLGIEYCEQRKLFTAVNSCRKFYVCLEDRVHKNRLIIPFFNNNKVVCYQSRALLNNQTPKYLTKFGEKELFGVSNIDSNIPYIFVFEGPIDSMFIKNGVALASLSPTEKQLSHLHSFVGYEIIYVFDNDKNNKQTSKKIEKHLKDGRSIFIWPKELRKFKDFNELCVTLNVNEVSWKFVVKNSSKGSEALLKQKILKVLCA